MAYEPDVLEVVLYVAESICERALVLKISEDAVLLDFHSQASPAQKSKVPCIWVPKRFIRHVSLEAILRPAPLTNPDSDVDPFIKAADISEARKIMSDGIEAVRQIIAGSPIKQEIKNWGAIQQLPETPAAQQIREAKSWDELKQALEEVNNV